MAKKISSRMVDVSAKKVTKRTARAVAIVKFSSRAYVSLKNGESPKGDVLQTARIAGIMAAKSTPDIIPMCHPLEISKVDMSVELNDKNHEVKISAEVVYKGRTGVEMEALMAVSAAALTVYDMMKWADKAIVISEIKLVRKAGGKSGDFKSA